MKEKHILIISFAYPPLPQMGSYRVSQVSKELYKQGWIPHVITAKNPKLKQILPLEIPEELVHYVDWPDIWKLFPFLEKFLLGRILSKGLRFMFPFGSSTLPETRRFWWRKPAISKGLEICAKYDIKIIYGSFSPPSTIFIANNLHKKTGIPWIHEFRDLWTLHPYYKGSLIKKYFEQKIEKKLLEEAVALTANSTYACEDLEKLHNKKTHLIYGGYDNKESIEHSNDKFTMLYTGTVYRKEDTEPLFKALRRLSKENDEIISKIKVVFYGPKLPQLLAELVENYQLSSIVELNDSVDHSAIIKFQQKADAFLLLLGWKSPKEIGVIPGKLFEYIGYKKPILAITYPKGAVNDILTETGLGQVLIDEDSIISFLKQIVNNQWSNNKSLILKKYSRESQVSNLIDIFKQHLKS